MTPQEREQMNWLSLQIQEERNPQKFETLLRELNELVGRKKRRVSGHQDFPAPQRTRPWRTVPAVVKRIVKDSFFGQAERVEISIAEADDLFREVRIENWLIGVDGDPVALKSGVYVEVTFEAEAQDTVKTIADRHA